MSNVLEVIDKSGKKIYLSKERYKHILKHPNMDNKLESIKSTIEDPTTVRYYPEDKDVRYFYKEFKEMSVKERYLLVSVKYLNGEGFIITSFFTNKITGLKWEMK